MSQSCVICGAEFNEKQTLCAEFVRQTDDRLEMWRGKPGPSHDW